MSFLKVYINSKHPVRLVVFLILFVMVIAGITIGSFLTELYNEYKQQNIVTYDSQKETVSPEERSYYKKEIIFYGYRNLSNDKSVDLYNCIDENIDNTSSFMIKCEGFATDKQISEAIMAYKNDHPEVFWLKDYFEYYNHGFNTYVKLTYNMDAERLKTAKIAFDARLKEIVSSIPSNKSEYETEKYINDYLVKNCKYPQAQLMSGEGVVGNDNDAYGALVEGSAVCEGYARAFQLLCNSVGIECVNIVGFAEEPHQWNCVKIENQWYQIDVTWNDCEEDEFACNRYFNLTDKEIRKTHSIADLFKDTTDEAYKDPDVNCNVFIPKCISNEYSFVNQEYAVLHNLDNADNIVEKLADKARKGETYLHIVFDNGLDYASVKDDILYSGYLYDWFDKANKINDYSPQINCDKGVYVWDDFDYITFIIDYN